MTLLACIGVVGSWLIGILDDRIGTKKTMILFGIWYILALLANVSETKVGIYLSIFMIGMAIGGSANFTTSLPASIFGRHGFDKVNSVIFPIQGLVTSLCFAVNGIVLNLTGDLRYAYLVFAGVAAVIRSWSYLWMNTSITKTGTLQKNRLLPAFRPGSVYKIHLLLSVICRVLRGILFIVIYPGRRFQLLLEV